MKSYELALTKKRLANVGWIRPRQYVTDNLTRTKNHFSLYKKFRFSIKMKVHINFFQDEKMGLLMLGAVAGGVSGAAGYFIAERFHDEEKIETIYPMYAAALFIAIVIASRFITF